MRQPHLSALPTQAQARRTIADLAGVQDIGPAHLAEAIQLRPQGVEECWRC